MKEQEEARTARERQEREQQQREVLNAGGFGAVPAGMHHYGWTDGGTVVFHGNGPFAITYVNPADDPSKGMTKASD